MGRGPEEEAEGLTLPAPGGNLLLVVQIPGTRRWGLVLRVPAKPWPVMMFADGDHRRRAHAVRRAESVLRTLRATGMAVTLDVEQGPDAPRLDAKGGAA